MRKIWAKIILTAIAAVGALCTHAASPATSSSFNVLCINRADGVTERLLLHTAMGVTVNADGAIMLVHPELTVELPAADVANFTFEDNGDITDTYDGDHKSGISAPEAPAESVAVSPDGITSPDDISVYDLKGVRVACVKAEGGSAKLLAGSLPSGVYIVKSGSTTLKIKL